LAFLARIGLEGRERGKAERGRRKKEERVASVWPSSYREVSFTGGRVEAGGREGGEGKLERKKKKEKKEARRPPGSSDFL